MDWWIPRPSMPPLHHQSVTDWWTGSPLVQYVSVCRLILPFTPQGPGLFIIEFQVGGHAATTHKVAGIRDVEASLWHLLWCTQMHCLSSLSSCTRQLGWVWSIHGLHGFLRRRISDPLVLQQDVHADVLKHSKTYPPNQLSTHCATLYDTKRSTGLP